MGNTILDQIKAGSLLKDTDTPIDSQVYSLGSNLPIKVGVDDPNIIGPDDTYDFRFRDEKDYPNIPNEVKLAEARFVLPMAKFIANSIGITVLDESAYDRVLHALRLRSLFVLLNLHKTKIEDGVASWFGLILICKKHPVVMVRFKLHISSGRIGIDQVRLWEKSGQRYVIHRNQDSFLSREESSAQILNYLKAEGILSDV